MALARSSVTFLALALLAGCATAPASGPPVAAGPFAQPVRLAGTQWRVVAINDRAAPSNGDYSVGFEGNRVRARFGCNHFSGDYRIQSGQLIIPMLAGTRMACIGPVGAMEGMGTAVMRAPMAMGWSGPDQLTLTNAGGTIVLVRS